MVARNFITVPGEAFTASGAGAVERTVDDKLRDVVSVLDFIPLGTDTANVDCSSFVNNALTAIGSGSLFFPAGTYKLNITVKNRARIIGAGRNKTTFTANNNTLPIITFADELASQYYFMGGEDFTVDGLNAAQVGIKVGITTYPLAGNGSVTYGSLARVHVKKCLDKNIWLRDTIGFSFTEVYSDDSAGYGLYAGTGEISTVVSFHQCQFRTNNVGVYLDGGAYIDFNGCIIESNAQQGLNINRMSSSGARSITVKNTWFEGNGGGAGALTKGTVLISIIPTSTDLANGIKFDNSNISSPPGIPDVILERGNVVTFDTCQFSEFNSTRLVFTSGAGVAYANLMNCFTLNKRPEPSIYANFPATVISAGKIQGFTYEYWYQGLLYTNKLPTSFYLTCIAGVGDVANVTGNGATYTSEDLDNASSITTQYDYGVNINNSVFTAPERGVYQFSCSWPITNFSAAMNKAEVFFIVNPGGSQVLHTVDHEVFPSNLLSTTDVRTFSGAAQLFLNKADTVVAAIRVSGGAGNTAALSRASAGNFGAYYFTGVKLA